MRKPITTPNIRHLVLGILGFCVFSINSTSLKAEVTYSIPLEGKEYGIGNMLEWSTAKELDSEHFVIERSFDGRSFHPLKTIEATGSSFDETNYHFMDLGINEKKAYYRLRQLDFDGSASISQTIMVKKLMSNHFMISSMTVSKAMSIEFDLSSDGEMEYSVHNMDGETIVAGIKMMESGLNHIDFIKMKDEKPGTYLFKFKMKEEEEQVLITKEPSKKDKEPNVASQGSKIGG